jgi:hypothetical protein
MMMAALHCIFVIFDRLRTIEEDDIILQLKKMDTATQLNLNTESDFPLVGKTSFLPVGNMSHLELCCSTY